MLKRIHITLIAALVLVQGFAMSLHVAVDHANTAHHYFFHHESDRHAEAGHGHGHSHSHGDVEESTNSPHCAVEGQHHQKLRENGNRLIPRHQKCEKDSHKAPKEFKIDQRSS